MTKLTAIALIIASASVLTACDKATQTDITKPAAETIGLANPAAKYCLSINGTLDMNVGLCTLEGGEKIDQWTLYKRDHMKSALGMANPAAKYCESLNGTLDMDVGLCTLESGEQMDQWALYQRDHLTGESAPSMANPAAKYCESLNGTLDMDVGLCTLESGEQMDQWALYQRDHLTGESAPTMDMANPAAKYCESIKGKLDLTSGICTLPSGENIEHWALYQRDHQ